MQISKSTNQRPSAKLLVKESLKSIGSKLSAKLPAPFVRQLRRKDYRIRGVEPEINWLEEWCPRDKVAIDVGANRGDYALFLSEITDNLFCFEPNPGLAEDLRGLFSDLPVTVENMALGDEEGEFELNIPYIQGKELHGWASLDKDFAGESWMGHKILGVRKEKVTVKRLDDLGIENLGFMKVDVEGHEFAVLKGAEKTIREQKPNLLVEIEQRHLEVPIQDIFDWLESLGYSGFFLDDGTLRPISEFDPDVHQKSPDTSSYRNNFYFSPRLKG